MAAKQQSFVFHTWGGWRKKAGRKPKHGDKAGASHLTRPTLAPRFPVLVTWRMDPEVWNMRSRRCFTVMRRAMYAGALRFGFRLVHYAVMSNHVHLIVEAPDRHALARGLKGLGVRIARALNRVMGRQGRVIGERYHARILKTPAQTKRARHYLLTNAHKHYGYTFADPFASREAVVGARTWLLRRAPL
jgi:REP element-mobilizing transposase RayT